MPALSGYISDNYNYISDQSCKNNEYLIDMLLISRYRNTLLMTVGQGVTSL